MLFRILFYIAVWIVIGTATGMIGTYVWAKIDDYWVSDARDDPGLFVFFFALWVIFWPLGLAVAFIVGLLGGIGFLFYQMFRICLHKALPSG